MPSSARDSAQRLNRIGVRECSDGNMLSTVPAQKKSWTALMAEANLKTIPSVSAMSEQQLQAFLEAVKADAGLQQKLQEAADLQTAVAIAKDAGFEIEMQDWLVYHSEFPTQASDDELEEVAGAYSTAGYANTCDVGAVACTKANIQGCNPTLAATTCSVCSQNVRWCP